MFRSRNRQEQHERAVIAADHAEFFRTLTETHAIVEHSLDAHIVNANEHALRMSGYTLDEIIGKPSTIFLGGNSEAMSDEIQKRWLQIREGKRVEGDFRCFGKGGRTVWMKTTYHPIRDESGKLFKVMTYSLDITKEREAQARAESECAAIRRSMAVIEFGLDGTILDANDNFLNTFGYTMTEVRGRHHSMFVDPAHAQTAQYREFWEQLRKGDYVTGTFRRLAKGQRVLWLEASYSPLFDPDGRPMSVIKYANDVTAQHVKDVSSREQIAAIGRSQAVIHFALDGTIQWANDVFLKCMGYTFDEIRGKHHRIFVDPALHNSREYREFWENLNAGTFLRGEFRRIAKDRSARYLSATYTPINDTDGKPVMVIKFASDITSSKERQLAQADLVQNTFDTIVEAVMSVGNRSRSAADASEFTTSAVASVAASTEELDASIVDIARSMTASKEAVEQAMGQTGTADSSTQQLNAKISMMNDVVTLIKRIAEQINMLSLNASIEAARAGSAGRGFAVVASEIKSLANQVATASQKIEQDIRDVQVTSSQVVRSLAEISQAIEGVQQGVVSTATAVEEQSSVTGTIASSMKTASSSVADINHSLGEILRLVAAASASANEGKERLSSAI